MSDIYISCAEQDAPVLRLAANALRAEGWSVWCNPVLAAQSHEECDNNLNNAGAVMVVWSTASRDCEHVRSEAAMGLYRNKLVQVTLDAKPPPRPFDQVETTDLQAWTGDCDDPKWQRIVSVMRTYAGEPGSARPHVIRRQPEHVRIPSAQPRTAPMAPVHAEYEAAQAFAKMPMARDPYRTALPAEPAPAEEIPETRSRSAPSELHDKGAPQAEIEPPPSPRPSEAARTEAQPRFAQRDDSWARSSPAEPDDLALTGSRKKDPHSVADIGLRPRYRKGVWSARPARSNAPVAFAAAVIAAGGAFLWIADPLDWRSGAAPSETLTIAAATSTPTPEPADSDLQARAAEAWAAIDRSDPNALRSFIHAYDRTEPAESARALLRVADASAWAEAVAVDNQAAYTAYLAAFPTDIALPGAMANEAVARLGELDGERQRAIADIQTALKQLNYYDGQVSGAATPQTLAAIDAFAAAGGKRAPSLTKAAPRELRAYSETLRRARPALVEAPAPAVLAGAEAAAFPAASAAVVDRLAPSLDAQLASEPSLTRTTFDADAAASGEMAKLETNAWRSATLSNTDASYRAYLARFPSGAYAMDARTALERLNRPAPFSEQRLSGQVRAVVASARSAQASAAQRAAAAREAAELANTVAQSPSARDIVAPDGDRYRTEIAGGSPNGLGLRISGKAVSDGDQYRGELRNGLAQGLGVYTFADNPNNAAAGALRYEGEHAGDEAAGFGVTYWKNGETFFGEAAAASGGRGKGVLTYPSGQRYEGELRNGARDGMGVVWSAEGDVVMSGRWENGKLVERTPRD